MRLCSQRLTKRLRLQKYLQNPQQKKKEVTFLGNLFFIKGFKIYLV